MIELSNMNKRAWKRSGYRGFIYDRLIALNMYNKPNLTPLQSAMSLSFKEALRSISIYNSAQSV